MTPHYLPSETPLAKDKLGEKGSNLRLLGQSQVACR